MSKQFLIHYFDRESNMNGSCLIEAESRDNAISAFYGQSDFQVKVIYADEVHDINQNKDHRSTETRI